MRDIRYIVVHCTATAQAATVEAIQRYWQEVQGWRSPGYHVIILPNGSERILASDEKVCNGVAGHNSYSLHVSYIGGIYPSGKALDNRTPAQKAALIKRLKAWKQKYPQAIIQGHRDFPGVTKACPSFDARIEYAGIT